MLSHTLVRLCMVLDVNSVLQDRMLSRKLHLEKQWNHALHVLKVSIVSAYQISFIVSFWT